jgi:hypothetical protein
MYNNYSGPINSVVQQMIASNSVVNQVGPLPLNPPPIMPMVPQSDQVHYGGSTGTLEIPSSSRPLKRKSVAQTSESYDQSERDTTQITENINPAAAR